MTVNPGVLDSMEQTPQPPTVFDTDQQQLGDVYAKALLGVGATTGNVDTLVDQLGEVAQVVQQMPKLKATLESPRVDVAAKQQLIEKAFAGKVETGLLNFLKVLAQKNRFSCLSVAAASASDMRDEAAGRVKAVMTTASDVDDSVRQRVASRLGEVLGKTVTLESRVDPEVIGGMVIRVGDTVYDGSVVNQLAQVRERAIKSAADAIRDKLDRFVTTG